MQHYDFDPYLLVPFRKMYISVLDKLKENPEERKQVTKKCIDAFLDSFISGKKSKETINDLFLNSDNFHDSFKTFKELYQGIIETLFNSARKEFMGDFFAQRLAFEKLTKIDDFYLAIGQLLSVPYATSGDLFVRIQKKLIKYVDVVKKYEDQTKRHNGLLSLAEFFSGFSFGFFTFTPAYLINSLFDDTFPDEIKLESDGIKSTYKFAGKSLPKVKKDI